MPSGVPHICCRRQPLACFMPGLHAARAGEGRVLKHEYHLAGFAMTP